MSGYTKEYRNKILNETKFLPSDASTAERIFCLKYSIRSRPKCKTCFGYVKFCYDRYRDFCSVSCSRKHPDTQRKYRDTNVKLYGVENPSQSPRIKQKKRETCLQHYGVDYPLQSNQIKNGYRQIVKSRYGVDNVSKHPSVKQKKIDSFMWAFGVENCFQDPKIKEKSARTCLLKYGYKNAHQSPDVKEKYRQTCIKKYGVNSPLQDSIVLEKVFKFRMKRMMIEGVLVQYQGYENVGWDYLLNKMKIPFKDIVFKKKDVPRITYVQDSRQHYYFPDFYIPKMNLIVEVKSPVTYVRFYIKNIFKRDATVKAGYRYQFWICSNKELLEILSTNKEEKKWQRKLNGILR